jgi:hypothetical protein
MRTLDENKREQSEYREKICAYEKRLKELQIEETEIRYSGDFPIGKHIFEDKREYEIFGYDTNNEILIRKIRKDGTLSKKIQYLCSWELKELTDINGNKILKQGE